jgi:hypothetical protein
MAATLGGSRPNADPFSEHVQVMKALYQEYTKRDDIQAVELVDSMLHEMNTLCRQREEAVKDIIKSRRRQSSSACWGSMVVSKA